MCETVRNGTRERTGERARALQEVGVSGERDGREENLLGERQAGGHVGAASTKRRDFGQVRTRSQRASSRCLSRGRSPISSSCQWIGLPMVLNKELTRYHLFIAESAFAWRHPPRKSGPPLTRQLEPPYGVYREDVHPAAPLASPWMATRCVQHAAHPTSSISLPVVFITGTLAPSLIRSFFTVFGAAPCLYYATIKALIPDTSCRADLVAFPRPASP
jgi:hypothetical protein